MIHVPQTQWPLKVSLKNNILDLSANPELTVNTVTSQQIKMAVFTRSSHDNPGGFLALNAVGSHQWPFKAAQSGSVDAAGLSSVQNIFHKLASLPNGGAFSQFEKPPFFFLFLVLTLHW